MQLTPPENDQQSAKENHLTFEVMHREAPGERWLVVEQDIESIEAALSVALAQETPHTCIFTSAGFRYWGSDEPELFNSSVLDHPQMITRLRPDGFSHITWRIYPESSSRAQLKMRLKDFAKIVGSSYEIIKCEPYENLENLFHVWIKTPMEIHDPDEARAHFEEVLQRIGEHWDHRHHTGETFDGHRSIELRSYLTRGWHLPWISGGVHAECTNAMSVPAHLEI